MEYKEDFYYKRDKNSYVTFKDGRPKEKLRKFIADGANKLHYLDGTIPRFKHREKLIIAYEQGGVDMLIAYFISELERIKKAIKDKKAKVIKSKDNG